MNFVDNGTDESILKSLSTENVSDDLVKAMNKQGLVQKEIQVRTKNGMVTRRQWVKASQDQPADKPVKKQEETKTSSGVKYDPKSTGQSDEIDSKFEKENAEELKNMVSGGTVNEVSPYPGQKGYTYLNYTDKDGRNHTASLKASPKKVREILKTIQTSPKSSKKSEPVKEPKTEDKSKESFNLTVPTGVDSKKQIQKLMKDNNLSSGDIMNQAKKQGISWKESSDDYDNWTNFLSAVTSTDSQSPSIITPKDKASLLQMLQSGSSREDIMAQAEKDGVTWKKSDHPGINWMRASMAMTGTSTKGQKASVNNKKDEKSSEQKSENGVIDKDGDLDSVIGNDYTKLTTDEEADTIEGEAHNMIVGRLKSQLYGKTPTASNIRSAAANLFTATKNSLIMSGREDDIKHNTELMNHFNKLAGNNYTLSHEDVLKDALASDSTATTTEKCSALCKLMGDKTYYNGSDGVFTMSDSGATTTVKPFGKGYFKATFTYKDGASRSETYDSISSVKKASDKFIKEN